MTRIYFQTDTLFKVPLLPSLVPELRPAHPLCDVHVSSFSYQSEVGIVTVSRTEVQKKKKKKMNIVLGVVTFAISTAVLSCTRQR